jgi:hypothetical protein
MRSSLEMHHLVYVVMADYWRRIDRQITAPAEDLFVEHGTLQLGPTVMHGRESIGEFLRRRAIGERASGRTTRHQFTNLLTEVIDTNRVRAFSIVQVMAEVGEWPLPSGPAATIADFEDVLVCENGECRFESRRANVVFLGPSAARFLK